MTKLQLKFILILLVLPVITIQASIKQSNFESGAAYSVEQHEIIDIVFESENVINDPFELKFQATVTGPSGEKKEILSFYNGENQWIIRFSASETGIWNVETSSKHNSFNKQKTTIEVTSNQQQKPGAIVMSQKNPRKFSYEDGSTYMLRGFECDWLFALDYENKDAAPKTEHLLDLLKKNGINQIITTLYSYDVRWDVDGRLARYPEHNFAKRDDIYPFLGTNQNPDFSSLNVTFFQRFDRIIDLMHERNIAAHLMVYVWNKKVKWPETGSIEDDRFFDYVIKRYQAFPNIIWDVAKEAFRRPEEYVLSRIKRVRPLDAYDRLMTLHDYNFSKNYASELDFISTQDWSSSIFNVMRSYHDQYEMPVLNIEHGGYTQSPYVVFPGDYTNPEVCLRRNYLCYFAGVYGNYYWQGAAWNVIIYNPFEQSDYFLKPKFEYYKHMADFFDAYDYNQFNPHELISRSGYCLKSKDESTYLLYLPHENHQLSLYGKDPIAAKKGTYQWFNVLTGEYSKVKIYRGGNLRSPWSGEADTILIRETTMKP